MDRGFGSVGEVIGWTRWTGGTTTTSNTLGNGTTTQDSNSGGGVSPNGGTAYVWGTRAINLPTSGTATYTLLGAAPVGTTDNQTPGSVDSGTVRVAFGSTTRVGVELGVRVAGNDYLVGSSGGIAAPSLVLDNATKEFSGVLGVTGGTVTTCTASTCAGRLDGFLAGNGASHSGVAFTFPLAPGRSASASGSAAFVKGP